MSTIGRWPSCSRSSFKRSVGLRQARRVASALVGGNPQASRGPCARLEFQGKKGEQESHDVSLDKALAWVVAQGVLGNDLGVGKGRDPAGGVGVAIEKVRLWLRYPSCEPRTLAVPNAAQAGSHPLQNQCLSGDTVRPENQPRLPRRGLGYPVA